MSKEVKPIIHGLDEPIKVYLGKRLADIGGYVTFECPDCGHKQATLHDTAELEYGGYYGCDSCYNCGVMFEDYDYKVEATVKISIVEEE